jgi:hypothetical protein
MKTILAAVSILLLAGCSNEGLYEPVDLGPEAKSAHLVVRDGKGRLTIKYDTSVFIAHGKIESFGFNSFRLVSEDIPPSYLDFVFTWKIATRDWICAACSPERGTKNQGASSYRWKKVDND